MTETDTIMAEETIEESMRRLELVGYQHRLPGTDEEAAKVEKLLAEEMNTLSMAEHDAVSFGVHGIAVEVQETPELLARSLIELERELQNIKKKTTYEKALAMNPTYVTDRSFRLKFLRCEDFNCKKAAIRLVLHFRQKEELFGSGEVLGRDVRLSDLDPKDLEGLKRGVFQVLPTTDISGRAVLCMFLGRREDVSFIKVAHRLYHYAMQGAMQDESMQKKGLVIVVNFVEEIDTRAAFNFMKTIYPIRLAVPHKLEAMHICYYKEVMRPLVSGVRFFLDKRGRTRSRVHFGTVEHILFQLLTYGIPIPEDSPLRPVNGEYSLSWHNEWLQMRQTQEMREVAGTDEKPKTLIPHRFDVLFGRGSKARCHTGTLRVIHLVDLWQARYDEAPNRAKKSEISDRIVGIVHESGGKFLKWEGNGWVEVEDEMARDKVAHFFRNRRKQNQESEETKSAAPKRSHSLSASS